MYVMDHQLDGAQCHVVSLGNFRVFSYYHSLQSEEAGPFVGGRTHKLGGVGHRIEDFHWK